MIGHSVWIALVHVKPGSANKLLGGARGAYLNALALAHDEESFESAVTLALEKRGFAVLDIEDTEPLVTRLETHTVDSDLMELAEKVQGGTGVQFGTFHTYLDEQEERE